MFLVSVSMSLLFGFISHSLLTRTGSLIAILIIVIFIFLAVVFDMISVAVVSADQNCFKNMNYHNIKGSKLALSMCQNCEKVCSFCGDVVGDICSTLSGAGGACIVITLTNNNNHNGLLTLVSISVSALIAGLTIFFKALMKEYALKNANKIILKLGAWLENSIFRNRKYKNLFRSLTKG